MRRPLTFPASDVRMVPNVFGRWIKHYSGVYEKQFVKALVGPPVKARYVKSVSPIISLHYLLMFFDFNLIDETHNCFGTLCSSSCVFSSP